MLAERLNSPVAVLLGGTSAERDISLQSGNAVLQALQNKGIAAVALDTAEAGWVQELIEHYQHVFIALHGINGEDGTVQGLLEMLGISYTGSGVMASALAMDKMRCKQLWDGVGLPTAEFAHLQADSDWQGLMAQWGEAMVKPAHEGSSLGMAKVNSAEQLEQAYHYASQYDAVVIAERWIKGAEFTVAVLAGVALPPIRLETANSFYDYEAKYISNDTKYICPCGLAAEQEQLLKQLAEQAFVSIGCTGWGRVDFMQDEQGNFYLLEVNTVPGMTSHSLVPMAAKAVGMSFDDLVEAILALSVES
ncbi:D-alanine--D-alanine ligase [Dasania marina]|uniref:D-alanine--D-alanine ligase n=1 Tax=Dasania marina TaxID=471499 RepID=UPI0030D81B2B|tara:strand:+ start:32466 stop:33383 length:918 start_codon:yes stop_codon:yes gene_type:complete